jgi:multicomponent Na+:H+ antiporter subunit F
MNEWLVTAAVLLLSLVPCGVVCARAAPIDRLVALELAVVVDVVILLVLAQGFRRDIYFDVALVLAFLSFAGALVFIRFVERWV